MDISIKNMWIQFISIYLEYKHNFGPLNRGFKKEDHFLNLVQVPPLALHC